MEGRKRSPENFFLVRKSFHELVLSFFLSLLFSCLTHTLHHLFRIYHPSPTPSRAAFVVCPPRVSLPLFLCAAGATQTTMMPSLFLSLFPLQLPVKEGEGKGRVSLFTPFPSSSSSAPAINRVVCHKTMPALSTSLSVCFYRMCQYSHPFPADRTKKKILS